MILFVCLFSFKDAVWFCETCSSGLWTGGSVPPALGRLFQRGSPGGPGWSRWWCPCVPSPWRSPVWSAKHSYGCFQIKWKHLDCLKSGLSHTHNIVLQFYPREVFAEQELDVLQVFCSQLLRQAVQQLPGVYRKRYLTIKTVPALCETFMRLCVPPHGFKQGTCKRRPSCSARKSWDPACGADGCGGWCRAARRAGGAAPGTEGPGPPDSGRGRRLTPPRRCSAGGQCRGRPKLARLAAPGPYLRPREASGTPCSPGPVLEEQEFVLHSPNLSMILSNAGAL